MNPASTDRPEKQPAGTGIGTTTDQDTGTTRKQARATTKTRIGVLRGTRAGALLATIVLAVLAVRFTPYDAADSTIPLVLVALYLPTTLIIWWFAAAIPRDLHPGSSAQRAAGPVVIALLWTGCTIIYYFELEHAATVTGSEITIPGYLAAIGALSLGVGVLVCADMLLRTHPARRSGGPHDIARWRPLPTADTSRTATTLTCLITLVLALAMALAPTWATRPIQQTAPEPAQIPAVPTTVAGDLAWTLDLDDEIDTLAAGAAGPILADGSRILGLDPADGSTRWTYHRPNAQLLNLPAPSTGMATRIMTGPDRRYAAFAAQASGPMGLGMESWYAKKQVVVTVLDTLTGRVAAEHTLAGQLAAEATTVPATQPIQLTDTAALIGTEAIDLATGTTLWTLPESDAAGTTGTPAHVGPAGHSTFVLRSEPGSDMATDLVLVPQDDPDRRTHLSTVATSANRPLIIDGWTIHYTDEPTYAEGSLAAAINLDEVAAGGTDGVQGIGLGRTVGPDLVRSRTSLVTTAPPTERDDAIPQPAAVFDPVTRTASPAGRSTTVDITTFAADLDREEGTVLLHLVSADGSVTNDLKITDGDRYNNLVYQNQNNGPGERFRDASLIAAPGALLVFVKGEYDARICALRQP
ncbi:Quinoprotein alcohol dehydrogenase-like superfamily [Propionibacterium ruminifibrarum]|uniref:Quinoprotein alcohol dehydrogenase-like superfamily n=1 Tax=Propionibacterium ruminifibrarum TaxID=1962131 RepID=A0A375I6F2_9ACTN|nr:hypothetical protein [Propionibacterium ruminifibrarum]SPF69436.1 Quinoprotein alcohol dehydrogenase-like superfamily [Propionibacterium ruminifibrarum]